LAEDAAEIGNTGKLRLGHGAASTLEVPAVRASFRQPQSISFLHTITVREYLKGKSPFALSL
jgi:hypothetical protein